MAFSLDLRERVIAAVDNGFHVDKVKEIFKISRRVIYEWLELRRETGSLAAKTGFQKGHSHKITNWDQFKDFAHTNQQCTSYQMIAKWENLTGVNMSQSVILRALKKINFSFKKKRLIMPKQTKQNENNF